MDTFNRRLRIIPLLKWGSILFFMVTSPIFIPFSARGDLTINMLDAFYGPTNINAGTGNGRLTAAFSRRGEITLFKYPNPTYYDQISYRTAPSSYYEPRMGARENAGAFGGIFYRTVTATAGKATFFRDTNWEVSQGYDAPDSCVIITEYQENTLGIKVTQEDFVHPVLNVLVRRVSIEVDNPDNFAELKFLFFANFDPTTEKIPYMPVADWAYDNEMDFARRPNDFAAVYLPGEHALLSFKPEGGHSFTSFNFGEDLTRSISRQAPSGIFIVASSRPDFSEFQVGVEKGGKNSVGGEDPYYDMEDGILNGDTSCLGVCAKGFAIEINTTPFQVDIFMAAGQTLNEALVELRKAREKGASVMEQETIDFCKELLDRAYVPSSFSSTMAATVLRALHVAFFSQDPESGAIVASVATQPPYYMDWPRDGAYIQFALDVAGYTDLAQKHALFLASVIRKQDTPFFPAGTYGINYYADGVEGFPPYFLEWDETGLAVWAMVVHGYFIQDDCERKNYYRQVYPAVKLAGEALYSCRDEATGLACEYFNEGKMQPVRDAYGDITVLTGLRSAAMLARAMGDTSLAEKWESRADELDAAMEEYGEWCMYFTYPYSRYCRDVITNQAQKSFQQVQRFVSKEPGEYAYVGMMLIPYALGLSNTVEYRGELKEAVRVLLEDAPTQDTRHFAEIYTVTPTGQFEQRNDVPQNWSATSSYLAGVAVYAPEKVFSPLLYRPRFQCEVPSCGCSSTGMNAGDYYSPLANLLVWLIPLLIIMRGYHSKQKG